MALPRPFFAPSFRTRRNGLFFAVLVGALVYLATFVASAELALFATTLTWDQGMKTRATVEIPAVGDEASTPQAERVNQALAILRAMPDVLRAVPVSDEETTHLLKPWISQPGLLKSLPVPALIDVERKPDSNLSADDIQRRLKTTLHDVHVDDHTDWLTDLSHLVRGLAAIGSLMIAVAGLTLVIAVSLLCRAIVAAERETITLLHIMGADDADIADHFQFHARRLAMSGAGAGFVCAILSVALMLLFLHPFGNPGFSSLLRWFDMALVLVPVAAVGITAFSARLSVLNFLYTMP
jgi:cell division transport system permease protein